MPTQVQVLIPTALRAHTGDQATLSLAADNIGDLLSLLRRNHPSLGQKLFRETGELNRFINIYVNGEDIRFLENRETVLKDGDEVALIPAIAGGRE